MKIKKKISDDAGAVSEISKKEKARLTADIDRDLFIEFKTACVSDGKKINEAITEAVKAYLNK